jgi:hypothetical protein
LPRLKAGHGKGAVDAEKRPAHGAAIARQRSRKNSWRKRVSPTGGVHLSVRGERGRAGGLLGHETAGPRGEESRPEVEPG